jgi:methionyl-tRNA formyltransferase
MRKLKIAYFGTPSFSADLLSKLIADQSLPIEITMIVTQPDKKTGRKQIMTKSPVKTVAESYGIRVWDKTGGEEFMAALQDTDLGIVYAYGFRKLLPSDVLEAPKLKIGDTGKSMVNIHPSLLPRYRGASPIAHPLLFGDELTGVTLFVMDEKMDHGPVIAQEPVKIALNDVRPVMEQKLTALGFEMVKRLVTDLAQDRQPDLKEQDHARATHARFMEKDDGFLPYPVLHKALKNEALTPQELPHIVRSYVEKYHLPADSVGGFLPANTRSTGKTVEAPCCQDPFHLRHLRERPGKTIYDIFRGMYPWPGIWTTVRINGQDKRLKITEMAYEDNALRITKVQLEGKTEVDFPTFRSAYGLFY